MLLRYSPLKIFQYQEKLRSLAAENPEIQPPLHVRIKPTNVCTHNCRYCSYRADNLQLGRDMRRGQFIPREKMLEIIDDVAEMQVKAVTFSGGGDPFNYPWLDEAATRLAASGIAFASLTNGAKLEGAFAEVFAAHATWIRVSIDGWDAESYARYRRVPLGEHRRVLDNIAGFKALAGRCLVGVNIIVDCENAPHVFDVIRAVAEAGADSVKVSPCVTSDDGEANNAYHEPLFPVVRDQIQRACEAFPNLEIYDAYHAFEIRFDKPYTWCPYIQLLTVIGADLNVYSCQDKAYNLESGLLGSIADRRFRDFWMENKQKFFTICPASNCRHHCVTDRKNRLVLEYLAMDPDHFGFV